MSERDRHLMPIGTFSATTRLSVKALRLYDEMGLLLPERVDEFTGYRYYALSQVRRAEAIRFLRSVDMSLEEIALALAADPREWPGLLASHRARLEASLAAQQQKVAALSNLVEGMRQFVPHEITRKNIADQTVASVTSEAELTNVGAVVSAGFAAIMQALSTAGVAPAGAPFLILHDVIDAENAGRIETCVPVAAAFQPDEPVVSKLLPGSTVASTLHKGDPREVTPAYHALASWMSANGWEPSGPPRENYLNDPRTVPVTDLLTEVAWPMRRRDA